MEYCKCGSIKFKGKCTNRACFSTSEKRCSWKIGETTVKFNKKLTYNEALNEYKVNMSKYRKTKNENVIYYYE